MVASPHGALFVFKLISVAGFLGIFILASSCTKQYTCGAAGKIPAHPTHINAVLQMISKDDLELIHLLIDDVNIVERSLFAGEPSPQEARALLVPILRRWICEKNFYRVQKLIHPEKIKFEIFSESRGIKLCKSGYLIEWMGMLVFNGVGMGSAKIAPKHLANKPETIADSGTMPMPQDAKIFFEQRVLFLDDMFYTREEIIAGHANKLGGVHIDFRRTDKTKYIDKAKNYFGLEVKPKNNLQIMTGEEISLAKESAEKRNVVYNALELVAIDTARIFVKGVKSSIKALEEKIKSKD